MKFLEIFGKTVIVFSILVTSIAGIVNWIAEGLDAGVGYMAFAIAVLALLIATEERG